MAACEASLLAVGSQSLTQTSQRQIGSHPMWQSSESMWNMLCVARNWENQGVCHHGNRRNRTDIEQGVQATARSQESDTHMATQIR